MGDAVWAKLRYCPYWPGVLVETPTNLKQPANKFCVYFFGTQNYGFVDLEFAHSYLEHKAKYVKKGRGKNFNLAVEQCDRFIADPTSIQLRDKCVKIAKEFNVKKELENDDEWYATETVQQTSTCSECGEKDAYRLHIEACHRQEIEGMQNKIDELTEERKMLLAKVKQLEREKGEYVVENIIGHKKDKGGYKFLVSWKGYDSSEDSWVSKNDLHCPTILKKYLKSNNL